MILNNLFDTPVEGFDCLEGRDKDSSDNIVFQAGVGSPARVLWGSWRAAPRNAGPLLPNSEGQRKLGNGSFATG